MTMRRYEVVYVLAPTLTEEEVNQYAETYSQAAREKGAEVIDVDKWEKRKLAFRVKKYWEGYYTILTIEEEAADAVTELERRFKVNDAVIRFLSVRIDEELKRASKFRPEGKEESSDEEISESPSEKGKGDEVASVGSKTGKPEDKKKAADKDEKGASHSKEKAVDKEAAIEESKKETGEKKEKKPAAKKTSAKESSAEEAEPAAKEDSPAKAESKETADKEPVGEPEEEKKNG